MSDWPDRVLDLPDAEQKALMRQDPNRYLAQAWRERHPKPPTVAEHVRAVWAQVEPRPRWRRATRRPQDTSTAEEPPDGP